MEFNPKFSRRIGSLGVILDKGSADCLISKLEEAITILSDTHQGYDLANDLREIKDKLSEEAQGLKQICR